MKKILSVLCVLVLTVMLTACGKETIVGKYTVVEMSSGGQTMSAETLKSLGMTIELEVKEDKTAFLSMMGEGIELTYDDKAFTGKDEETGEEKSIPYKLDGKKLTLEIEGEKIVFQK